VTEGILLSIIIVNWNSRQQLRDCIVSIVDTHKVGFDLGEVIIVDNASSDDSLDNVDKLGVQVRIIRNRENRGFAAACNQGAALAKGDYLLFLNPDTKLFKNSLSAPIDFMQQPTNAKIGICGIRLLDAAGNTTTSAARFPILRVMAGKALGLSRLFPGMFPPHLMSAAELIESRLVDQVIGAFFLIRRNVFELCKGFDERFFVYFEEVDLSLRANQLGFSSYFISDVSAFHKGGGSSDQIKSARLFYSLRSRIQYAKKHYTPKEFITLILLTGLELPLRLIQGTLKASFSDVRNTLAAYKHLILYFFWEP
jgi:N-acetylglucosaminyl-diphospho-decaprenol L-rhamnosyltransferase